MSFRRQRQAESTGAPAPASRDSSLETLSLFMRDLGTTRLLDAEEEQQLARRIERGRRAIAKAAAELPPEWRRRLGLGRLRGSWSFARVDAFADVLERTVLECSPPATVRNVQSLVRRAKADLDRAREAFVVANLRLVVHVAKKYSNHELHFLDLVQEGSLGLLKAVERFEYRRGHKFSTYAYWWIKQSIGRAIDDKERTIRLPVHVVEKLKRIQRAERTLPRELVGDARTRALAASLGMSVKRLRPLLDVVQDPVPIDEIGDGRLDAMAALGAPGVESPVEHTTQAVVRESVERSLKTLDPRGERILRMRYGLADGEPHTLEEIGQKLSLSRERVRQLEAQALRRLRMGSTSRELRELSA